MFIDQILDGDRLRANVDLSEGDEVELFVEATVNGEDRKLDINLAPSGMIDVDLSNIATARTVKILVETRPSASDLQVVKWTNLRIEGLVGQVR